MVDFFFDTLKTEMTYIDDIETRAEAKNKIFEWIECFFNRTRIHSCMGFRSPFQFELDKHAA